MKREEVQREIGGLWFRDAAACHIKPFFGAEPGKAKVVIVGSFTSLGGLEAELHYGAPCNQLWKILGKVLDPHLRSFADKIRKTNSTVAKAFFKERMKKILEEKKVSICDIWKAAFFKNGRTSADKNIVQGIHNDKLCHFICKQTAIVVNNEYVFSFLENRCFPELKSKKPDSDWAGPFSKRWTLQKGDRRIYRVTNPSPIGFLGRGHGFDIESAVCEMRSVLVAADIECLPAGSESGRQSCPFLGAQ